MPKCTQCGQDVLERAAFCHWCGNQLMTVPAEAEDARIREIQLRVDDVASLVNQHAEMMERFDTDISYLRDVARSSRVHSRRFVVRAFAISGHVIVPLVFLIMVTLTAVYLLRVTDVI